MDILGFGDMIIQKTGDVSGGIIETTFGSASKAINSAISTVMTPINNISKGLGDVLGSLNPNLLLFGSGAIALLILLKK